MTIRIREAEAADAKTVGSLIDAMDTHYRGAGNTAGAEAAEVMVAQCLTEREGTRFFIASMGDKPVGLACFALLRPGRHHAGLLFLKDLFVVEQARGSGVGHALMAELARYARERQIGRIDLTTDTENLGAQRLYDGINARRQQKVAYTIEADALSALAARAETT